MLKKRLDQFIKNNFIKLECSPEMPSYLCLKILTNYLRSKYIRYEYCITNLPSNDINTIFINYNPNLLKEECFNLRIEDCKTCILRKFNQFVSCKFEFVTLFEYFSKLIGKSNLLCKECTSLKDEIILFEKKEKYPVYLFHNTSSLYLSLYHDMPFIKKYFKKDMSESIKYFLAKEGISISDSLQKFNQNVPLEEMFINKISTLEYYFVLLSELMNYTKKEKRVLREKTNQPTEKKDFLLEENKKSVIHNSDKSVKEGMALYYELIEKVLELLTSKSLRKGYVLLKREMVNDNLIMFISLYELFRYFKSEIFFLCENGYVIFHKKLNLKGEFLNDTVLLVEEKEIKRFLFNFNKL